MQQQTHQASVSGHLVGACDIANGLATAMQYPAFIVVWMAQCSVHPCELLSSWRLGSAHRHPPEPSSPAATSHMEVRTGSICKSSQHRMIARQVQESS